MNHFGVRLISKGKAFRLIREEFAIIDTKPSLPYFESLAKIKAYADQEGKEYSKTWCDEYRELCLKNFDLNMEYFSLLEKKTFDSALASFLTKHKGFVVVENLNDFSGIEGYYIMVLDEYKQVYIGKTKNIKKRIMQHWTMTRAFDRTLFPMYAWRESVFSIDFFRALDTTKIFVWKRKTTDGVETNLIRSFPSQFCTNRIGGDVTNMIQAIETINKRELF